MRRSKVGSYSGYLNKVANGYIRTSEYVNVRDGTLLAIDLLHPAVDGEMLGGRRPVVLRGTGYRRAFRRSDRVAYDLSRIPIIEQYPIGHIITPYEFAPVAKRLVDHGYVFASVDLRGTGASFGANDQPATIRTGQDLVDVIDWLAQQDWSDGKIGMWGRSWEAAVQLVTAAVGTPNLRCICPHAIGSTQITSTWYNGLFAVGFRWPYTQLRKAMELDELAMPVDGPDGEKLLADAVRNRERDFPWASPEALGEDQKTGAYADVWLDRSVRAGADIDNALGRPLMVGENPDAINASGIAVYWLEGWWDQNSVNSAVSLYNALSVPKKMTLGPWNHSQFSFCHEPHRWFDYWLKNIDNHIMDEPPLHYSVSKTDGHTIWRAADSLSPSIDEGVTMYLGAPEVESSERLGKLSRTETVKAQIAYLVDYDVSTGPQTRSSYLWKSVHLNYGDMNRRVGRCLSFTTEPLAESIELTGVPTLRLPLAATATPAAIFATLEEVQRDGCSRYLTEGLLNLEYRKELPIPATHFGATLHPLLSSEKLAVPMNRRIEVQLDLLALSVAIPAGCSLRLTISGADRDNYYLPRQVPAVELTIWCGGPDGASLNLPVVGQSNRAPVVDGLFEDDVAQFAFAPDDPPHR